MLMDGSQTAVIDISPPRDENQKAMLERLFRHLGEISTLPTTALRVVEVANDPDSAADDLLHVIEEDPALAARLMRTVNSGFYALRNQVGDLKTAITLLGFMEVRNMALTVYVARQFQQGGGYRSYNRENLWDHMIGVATAARHIAQVCHKAVPEEAYLAALLHDFGYILVDQNLHKRFRQVIDRIDEDVPTCEAETAILTFDHCELGAAAAANWQFPTQIVDAIRYHHRPSAYRGDHPDLVDIVAVANFLCSRRGLTSLGVHNVLPPGAEVFDRLQIERNRLVSLWDDLEETFARADLIAAV